MALVTKVCRRQHREGVAGSAGTAEARSPSDEGPVQRWHVPLRIMADKSVQDLEGLPERHARPAAMAIA